jgi:hypothetical protein
VLLTQICPAAGNVAVILRRIHQFGRIDNAVIVKKDSVNRVPFFDRGLSKFVGRVRRLMIIRTLLEQYSNIHKVVVIGGYYLIKDEASSDCQGRAFKKIISC